MKQNLICLSEMGSVLLMSGVHGLSQISVLAARAIAIYYFDLLGT